jgi:hypothetical protein
MEAMKARDFQKACPLIEKSIQVAPAMAAQFRLAECLEKLGRTASAWRHYREVLAAATAAGKTERATFARDRIAALEPKLTRIRLVVPDEVAKLERFEIEKNGEKVPADQWNVEIPVDPGEQRVSARAAGHEPWSIRLEVKREGETATLSVPLLRASTQAGLAPIEGDPQRGSEPVAPAKPSSREETITVVTAQGIAGIVIGSVGVVVMGIGGGVGLTAKSNYGESAPLCNAANECGIAGVLIREDARKLGNAGTAVFAVGGALTAAGIIVAATAPWKRPKSSTRLILAPSTSGGFLTIEGRLP